MTLISRRRLLATAALSGVLGTAVARTGGTDHDPTEAGGWRHPRATPGSTAATDVDGPQSADGVGWQRTLENPTPHRWDGLALAGDSLLVPTHSRLIGLSTAGDRRWARGLPVVDRLDRHQQIDSAPRVLGDRCFVASGASLYALDVADGRPRWRFDVNSSIDGVVLLGNTLYVSALASDGDALLAINATSGRERWQRLGRLVPLAATEQYLLAAEYDGGRLRGFDPGTGERRWESDLAVAAPSLETGTVAVSDETLWHVRGGTLTAADPTDGTEQWTADLHGDGSSMGDRLAVADGVYVVEPDVNRLSAFAADGDRRWDRDIDGAAHGVAVGGDTVYTGTERGLESVAAADGSRRFRVAPASTPGYATTPLVTDGAVFHVAGDAVYGVGES